MALIKCPECGKEVSDKATSCPQCGFPLSAAISSPSLGHPSPSPSNPPATKKDGLKRVLRVLIPSAISISFVLIFLVLCIRALNGPSLSSRAASLGKDAISITDDYLNGSISKTSATSKLDDVLNKIDMLNEDSSAASKALRFSTEVFLLSSAIRNDDGSSESYDKILERRNDVADIIGVRKRK